MVWYIKVSSANRATGQSTSFGRSLINIRKSTVTMTIIMINAENENVDKIQC